MAHSSLERLRQVRDIQVRWLSYELRPERTTPPSPEEERHMAAYKRKVEANWPNVQAMAQTYGITMNARNRNTRSRLALEAAKFAEEAGYMDAYAGALFHAHFTTGRDLSDVAVLVELADAVGMDGATLRPVLETRALKDRVDRELALAFTYKLSGVPAFIIGRKYLVVGAQPVETLIDVVDKCLE
jgi:predicted DsbA family dithiol-disulfide isomerase